MKMEYHTIDPVWDNRCKILILGSFPSVQSREKQFFYSHPQNRFWLVIAGLFREPVPVTVTEKKDLLLRNRIALWDVIAACVIEGSSDASIRDVQINDIKPLISQFPLRAIFTNGTTSSRLYRQYWKSETGITDQCLPSTSAANARLRLPDLLQAWEPVKTALGT